MAVIIVFMKFFPLQVLLLGLHELENPKNIERLKKDLKVRCFSACSSLAHDHTSSSNMLL